MRNFYVTLLFFFINQMTFAKNNTMIQYKAAIKQPQTHYVEVEILLTQCNEDQLHFKIPVWTPGSYLVREFGKSIEGVQAFVSENPAPLDHINKNTWLLKNCKGKDIRFTYKVYAFEASVRTSFIDEDHAFLHNTSIFMYVSELKNNQGSVTVVYPSSWKNISTSLPSDGSNIFRFANYDELADSPFEIGNHEILSFSVMGVPHQVAMVGLNNCDLNQFTLDLEKACSTMAQIIGEHPCKEYLFIVHNVEQGGGGLEHANSCTVMMGRWNWSDKDKYNHFIGLCAHEYFHLWNVKRLRPIELGPFDYDNENYTESLWVAEGITSYYDELSGLRMGIIDADGFATQLAENINQLENRPGSKVQTLAESSRDAWIKEYRPNENSKNTSISYYSKGLIVAALLDAKIFASTGGRKNLDDLMRLLYKKFYKELHRGFTPQEFIATASEVAEVDLTSILKSWIYSTEIPNYKEILESAGLEVNLIEKKEYNLGISTALENGRTIVKYVQSESAAWYGGINANDEIVAINGARISNDISTVLSKIGNPGILTAIVNRNGIVREITFDAIPLSKVEYTIKRKDTISQPEKNIWYIPN